MLNGGGGLNADGLALDLQFALDKTMTARKGPNPVFTRASSATFVGSDGLIQTAATNIPRFDHTSAGVCRGLLIEESRTNLSWPSAYTTADQGFGVFPAGSTTTTFNQLSSIGPSANGAALMLETATTQVHGGYAGTTRTINPAPITIVSGTVYTASIYVKSSGRTRCRFSFNTSSNIDGIFAAFNLSGDGSITTNSTTYGSGASAAGLSASITKNADGWFRLTVSGSLTNTGGFLTVETLDDSGNRSYLGDVTKGLLITNGQLEAGSFPTSYIPTTTGSVVRSADVCSITGANFTSFWNTNEGAIFASGDPRAGAGVATLVMANSGANANQIAFDRQTTTIKFGIANSGTYTATIQQNSTNGSFVKISGAYATNNARSALNGVLGTPDTSVIVPTNLNRFNIGSAALAGQEFANGCISEIKYFRKPLSNAKLQALTA